MTTTEITALESTPEYRLERARVALMHAEIEYHLAVQAVSQAKAAAHYAKLEQLRDVASKDGSFSLLK